MTITKGWKKIGTYRGVSVFVPKTKKLAAREFSDTPAYVMYGRIFVESEETWTSNPRLRAHEYTHVLQERVLGRKRCDRWYKWCNDHGSYLTNPFEVTAFLAGEVFRFIA